MDDELALINMNAREYDPIIGRFLTPDTLVDGGFSQGLNRYSYVRNNPLAFTDPTGHLSLRGFAKGFGRGVKGLAEVPLTMGTVTAYTVTGAMIGLTFGGPPGAAAGAAGGMKMGADAVGAKRDGVPTREILEGSAKGFAVMWVTAAAFYEVGSALKDAGLSGSWVKIPVHGITAGLISAAAGGDPTDVRSAFMGAAFGAAGGFAAESFKFDNVGYRALVGAIAARIAGGDAAQGAAWAAAAYLFNELAHPMRTSSAGLQAIAGHEGFSPTIYQDQAGYDTIGYGHKLTAGEAGLYSNGITEEQGLALLRQDVRTAELAVNRLVNVSLSQSQFDALVSFTYNVGSGNFANSTLLQQLNSGNYAGAADQFLRWNRVTINGQSVVSDGLTNRRIAERCMFGGC